MVPDAGMFQPFLRFYAGDTPRPAPWLHMGKVSTLLEILPYDVLVYTENGHYYAFQPFLRFYLGLSAFECALDRYLSSFNPS